MSPPLRRTMLCGLAIAACACGARTGLRVDRTLADAAVVDAAPPDPVCRPLRVRTRVGEEVPLLIEVDHATASASGYAWSLRQAPRRARAELRSPGDDTARITPDVEGPYDVSVTTPFARADGTALQCPVTVQADPTDPLCPGYALVEPSVVALPGGTLQFAFESAWSTPRVNAGGGGLVASDAPADDVAALVAEFPASGDLAATAGDLEGRVLRAVGATPVLVGREGVTPEGWRYRRSSFRVASLPTTAAVLRDRIARDVTGLNPGRATPGFSAQRAFVMEVTTVLRPAPPGPDGQRAVVLFAAASELAFDDPARATAYRLGDVTNTSGLAARGTELDVVCQRTVATRALAADFLWLVDTSRSMEDDQERLGNTAERFFREMTTAGIDFRVGVMQAGSTTAGPDLDDPGFAWIAGADLDGPQRLSWQVTYRAFRDEAADTLAPYPLEGQEEEPLAAGVVTTEAMERRGPSDPASRASFRPSATRVAFFVTDEAGTNDDDRYFGRDRARWGALREDRVRGVTSWYRDRGFLTFGMANLFARSQCPSTDNFIPCVVVGNGGAYIPLDTAADAEVSAALSRIVDAIAGAASEFTLPRAPISSTLRVRVGDRLAPRSRADGFDWDQDAGTIVFRGATYRPRRGQEVRSAYFLWVRR